MREIEIHSYARQLLEAHGPKAIAEAAQNAIDLEAKGELELAKDWRHSENALKLLRGPHQGGGRRTGGCQDLLEGARRHAGPRLARLRKTLTKFQGRVPGTGRERDL